MSDMFEGIQLSLLNPMFKKEICTREEVMQAMRIVSAYRKGKQPTREETDLVFKYALWTIIKTAAIMDIMTDSVNAAPANSSAGQSMLPSIPSGILSQLASMLGKSKKTSPKPEKDPKEVHGKDLADLFDKLVSGDSEVEDEPIENAGMKFIPKSGMRVKENSDGTKSYVVFYRKRDGNGKIVEHESSFGTQSEAMEKAVSLMFDPTVVALDQ